MAKKKKWKAPSVNGTNRPGPPTHQRRRYNRLKALTADSIDKMIVAFDKLNADYPDLIDAMVGLAKGKTTKKITLEDGSEVEVPLGDLQALKWVLGYYEDLYKRLSEALDWVDSKEQGLAPVDPTGSTNTVVRAIFRPTAQPTEENK